MTSIFTIAKVFSQPVPEEVVLVVMLLAAETSALHPTQPEKVKHHEMGELERQAESVRLQAEEKIHSQRLLKEEICLYVSQKDS